MQIRPTAFTIGLIIYFSIALFFVYTEFGIDSRTQEIEIHYRFDVAVATAVADSMKYDKKRKAA